MLFNFVGQVGFEPTQPYGNRFTVCPASPTAALTHFFFNLKYVKDHVLKIVANIRTIF